MLSSWRQYLPSARTTLFITNAALGCVASLYATSDDVCRYQFEIGMSNCIQTQLERAALAVVTGVVMGAVTYLATELRKEQRPYPNLFIEAQRRNFEKEFREYHANHILKNSISAAPAA